MTQAALRRCSRCRRGSQTLDVEGDWGCLNCGHYDYAAPPEIRPTTANERAAPCGRPGRPKPPTQRAASVQCDGLAWGQYEVQVRRCENRTLHLGGRCSYHRLGEAE
jgi:hypothetical protein